MPDLTNIAIVAVMDNLGNIHKINYETLENLPGAIKNPYSITIFG